MNFTVNIRPDAEIDIEDAAIWYEKQGLGLGGDFLDEIQRTLATMSENPYMCPVAFRHTRRALVHMQRSDGGQVADGHSPQLVS